MASFLDRILGKKDDPIPPGAGVGPVGDFNVDPQGHYPILQANAKGNGPDGWSPRVGTELPTLKNQDELLIHFDRSPVDDPQDHHGSPYYRGRNFSRLKRGDVEYLQSGGVGGLDSWVASNPGDALQHSARRDVKETPPMPSRPTAFQSPSNYRFLHAEQGMRGGRGDVRNLNGLHFSMASNRRAYPINGMRPAVPFRNTWRAEPPPRDAQMYDAPASNPTVPAGVYTSPVVTGTRSWRLT